MRTFALAIVFILLLFVILLSLGNVFIWHRSVLLGGILTVILFIIGIMAYFYRPRSRKASITIDDLGVHILKNGYQREYPWEDISGAKVLSDPHFNVNTGRTTHTDYLEIQRKGDLVHDARSYCPREDFGVGANDLAAIIGDGVARWGSGHSAT